MADPIGVISITAWALNTAWQTYRKCQQCPGEYAILCGEARQMANVLQDLNIIAEEHSGRNVDEEEFISRSKECVRVLEDLEKEVERYSSLGTQTRRAADRMAWDRERIRDLRSQMQLHITALSSFYHRLSISSTRRIEQALHQLFSEIQQGQRPATSVTSLTLVDEETSGEAWPDILRELEDVGLDRVTAQDNQDYILNWFRDAMKETYPPMNQPKSTDERSNSSDNPIPLSSLSQDSTPGPSNIRYMELFGDFGLKVDADVRKHSDNIKEDVNRAREFWDRKDWTNAIKYLMRILAASQLPGHRRRYIKTRQAAFLLGVAHTWSGDFETAIKIFVAVLEDTTKQQDQAHSYDDAEVAAATWLGDLCLKTNRQEDAVMFYAIAINSIQQKCFQFSPNPSSPSSARAGRGELRSTSMPSYKYGAPLQQSPTQSSFGFSRTFHDKRMSSSTNLETGTISNEVLKLHSRGLAVQLYLSDRTLGSVDDLTESIECDEYLSESVLADSTFFGRRKIMMDFVNQARDAMFQGRVDTNVVTPNQQKHPRQDPKFSRRSILSALNSSRSQTQNGSGQPVDISVTPAEEYLQLAVRSTEWPLLYDLDFSHISALEVITWYHNHTTIPGEGIAFKMPVLDSRASRDHDHRQGKPFFEATRLDPSKKEDVQKYVIFLANALSQMGFECREAPAEFRCRPRTAGESIWPDIGAVSVRVISYKPDGHFRLGASHRLAFYPGRVIYWDGAIEEYPPSTGRLRSFLEGLSNRIQVSNANDRGRILPNTRSTVAFA